MPAGHTGVCQLTTLEYASWQHQSMPAGNTGLCQLASKCPTKRHVVMTSTRHATRHCGSATLRTIRKFYIHHKCQSCLFCQHVHTQHGVNSIDLPLRHAMVMPLVGYVWVGPGQLLRVSVSAWCGGISAAHWTRAIGLQERRKAIHESVVKL